MKETKRTEIKEKRKKGVQELSQTLPLLHANNGVRGGAVVEAMRYEPEGRGFDSRWCHWIFSLT
jgi:hypothetical protein